MPNPADRLLKYFNYAHLPEELAVVSAKFSRLAYWVHGNLPEGPEQAMALRKLLEAKDCAVRAQIEQNS